MSYAYESERIHALNPESGESQVIMRAGKPVACPTSEGLGFERVSLSPGESPSLVMQQHALGVNLGPR
jgi:hypothetical protein